MQVLQIIFLIGILLCAPTQALLMMNSTQIPEEQKQVISFTEFVSSPTLTQGPVEVGNSTPVSVQWTGVNTNNNAFIGNDPYQSLGNNGMWNADNQGYTALNTANGSIRYTFAEDVNSVGAFMNYLPDSGNHVIVTAYDRSGQALESYDINNLAPISTFRGVNQGAFRGIQRTMSDIAMFEVSNSYVVLDHLSYGLGSPTPEPGTLFMTFIGLVGSFLYFKKVRK